MDNSCLKLAFCGIFIFGKDVTKVSQKAESSGKFASFHFPDGGKNVRRHEHRAR